MAFVNDIKLFTCQEPQCYIDISLKEENELTSDQYEVIIKLIQDESFPINTEPQQEVQGAIPFQEREQPSIQYTEPETTGDLVAIDFYIVHLSPDSEYSFV